MHTDYMELLSFCGTLEEGDTKVFRIVWRLKMMHLKIWKECSFSRAVDFQFLRIQVYQDGSQ